MAGSVANTAAASHRVIPEIDRKPAKAALRIPETVDFGPQIGGCLDAVRRELGWTLDQLAAELPPPPGADKRDPRQVQRWIDGKERCQVDVIFSVEVLREPFVIALARLAKCAVETIVTIRRRA